MIWEVAPEVEVEESALDDAGFWDGLGKDIAALEVAIMMGPNQQMGNAGDEEVDDGHDGTEATAQADDDDDHRDPAWDDPAWGQPGNSSAPLPPVLILPARLNGSSWSQFAYNIVHV